MKILQRRQAIASGAISLAACAQSALAIGSPDNLDAKIENPRGRVPLSFIIDDSTCLVNMGRYCMPQFAATYPDRESYKKPWQTWPNEIPDDFVRKFSDWCGEHGVKGKYSLVPNPACVGWLDRVLPGWSQRALRESLDLVRKRMLSNWDIHPEMITHTRVIDLKTGRPYPDNSPKYMENSYPQTDVSVDYLASYLAYALRILKNCDIPCEGVTTPGGFGNKVKDKLPLAVAEAVRDVYRCEMPHYFKFIANANESTFPKLEAKSSAAGPVVNVLAGTGDWFGGWDGSETSRPSKFCTEDGTQGRMVELIRRQQPAIMLCHWPGMFCNGSESGFQALQKVVTTINRTFRNETQWMKLSEIANYYAAKSLTSIQSFDSRLLLSTKLGCPAFTLSIAKKVEKVRVQNRLAEKQLVKVRQRSLLSNNTWCVSGNRTWICVDLQTGENRLFID